MIFLTLFLELNNMKTLETGQDKIQKICDKLRRDTLEPSLQEAERVNEAEMKAAGRDLLPGMPF